MKRKPNKGKKNKKKNKKNNKRNGSKSRSDDEDTFIDKSELITIEIFEGKKTD